MIQRSFYVAGYTILIIFKDTESKSLQRNYAAYLLKYFKDYIVESENKPDMTIEFIWDAYPRIIARKEAKEYYISFYKYLTSKRIETYYQLGIFQFQQLLREVIENLLVRDCGFLIHTSAVIIDGEAHLFLGRGGAGKSTIARFLSNKFTLLADDSGIIKEKNKSFVFVQSPLMGRRKVKRIKDEYKIGGIYFLRKDKVFFLKQVNNQERILEMILQQTSLHKDFLKEQTEAVYAFTAQLHSAYFLHFAKNRKKTVVLMETISGVGTNLKLE